MNGYGTPIPGGKPPLYMGLFPGPMGPYIGGTAGNPAVIGGMAAQGGGSMPPPVGVGVQTPLLGVKGTEGSGPRKSKHQTLISSPAMRVRARARVRVRVHVCQPAPMLAGRAVCLSAHLVLALSVPSQPRIPSGHDGPCSTSRALENLPVCMCVCVCVCPFVLTTTNLQSGKGSTKSPARCRPMAAIEGCVPSHRCQTHREGRSLRPLATARCVSLAYGDSLPWRTRQETELSLSVKAGHCRPR